MGVQGGADPDRRFHDALGLLAHLDVLLHVHCPDSSGRPLRGHELRGGSGGEGADPRGPGLDRDQLVHLPDRLRLPDDGDLGAEQRGRDPARVLRLGHHLEVRGGAADLPDHEREVKEHAGGRPRQVSKAGKGFKAYVPAMTQEAYEEEGVLFRTVASWQLRALCSVPLIFVVAVGWSLYWFPFMVVVCRLCMAVAGAAPIISPSRLHSDRAHCWFCLLLSSVFSDTLPSPTQCTHDG